MFNYMGNPCDNVILISGIDNVTIVRNNGVCIKHKGDTKMTITIGLKYNNNIYFASDSRSSRIDKNFRILNYQDDFVKIVYPYNRQFLLMSSGLNEFGEEKISFEQMFLKIIGNATQLSYPDSILQIAEKFQGKLREQYFKEVANVIAPNEINAIIQLCTTQLISGGYINGIAQIHYVTVSPIDTINLLPLGSMQNYIVAGSPDVTDDISKQLKDKYFDNESDVINTLTDLVDYAKTQSDTIGGETVIYKMSKENMVPKIVRVA